MTKHPKNLSSDLRCDIHKDPHPAIDELLLKLLACVLSHSAPDSREDKDSVSSCASDRHRPKQDGANRKFSQDLFLKQNFYPTNCMLFGRSSVQGSAFDFL